MSDNTFYAMEPRQLTRLEVIDIHILVKSTRPPLGILLIPKKPKDDLKA